MILLNLNETPKWLLNFVSTLLEVAKCSDPCFGHSIDFGVEIERSNENRESEAMLTVFFRE